MIYITNNKFLIIFIGILIVAVVLLGGALLLGKQANKGTATTLPTQQNPNNSQQGGPDTPGAPGGAPEAPGGANN